MAEPSKQSQAAVGHAGLAPVSQVPGRHAIIDMTPSGIVTGWNPVAVLLYGYQVDKIVGRAVDVLCLPEGRADKADILPGSSRTGGRSGTRQPGSARTGR